MPEIKINIKDSGGGLDKRFSRLEAALSRNNVSGIKDELQDLKRLIRTSQEKNEDRMISKLKNLDERLSSVFKLVSKDMGHEKKGNVVKKIEEMENRLHKAFKSKSGVVPYPA